MASIGVIGGSMGYPAGVYFEKLGPMWTFVTAGALGLGSNLLLMAATFTVAFYHNNVGLLITFGFIFGEYGYMPCI